MASNLKIARISGNVPVVGASFHPNAASDVQSPAKRAHYVGGGYNLNLKLAVTAANVPIQAEPLGPPDGSTVRIRTADGNAGTMYFAETREELQGGGIGEPLGAGFEIVFPYEKGRLWYMGTTVGDTASLSARSQ